MTDEIRVLVVDDDFMVAKVHRGYVSSAPGFTVVGVAATAAQAVQAVADLAPDLVLLDLYLPDSTVEDLLDAMLAPGLGCDVMVLSAANDLSTVRAAFQGGAVQYLIKPFGRDDLVARLADYRRRRESLDGAVRADGTVAQVAVDELFGRSGGPTREQPLPKGLAGPTLRLVVGALREASGPRGGSISATECGERVGLARVSARRYLEHLVETGAAVVEHRYGGSGRPERRYRWRDH
ncbi:response regulator [Nocardioides sp. Soil774]|uniref:response regulator n=1 Tax=Nocardioides sp. Soil774 TaxID=1736408 RepID=UPI000A56F8CC|nr:response regulator [Nocardioides sp. Soil774]